MDQQVTNQPAKKTPKWLLPVAILVAVVIAVIAIVAIVRQAGNVSNEAIPAQVVVNGSGFSPAYLKVKRGESVTWVNQDSTPHQIASLEPDNPAVSAFDSKETLGQGDTYTYTFEQAGTYTYGDKFEPTKYKGTIVVE